MLNEVIVTHCFNVRKTMECGGIVQLICEPFIVTGKSETKSSLRSNNGDAFGSSCDNLTPLARLPLKLLMRRVHGTLCDQEALATIAVKVLSSRLSITIAGASAERKESSAADVNIYIMDL